jgi:hypothetical protein
MQSNDRSQFILLENVCLFIWTEDRNTDDVTLEEIPHLISYDMYFRMRVIMRDSIKAREICRRLEKSKYICAVFL